MVAIVACGIAVGAQRRGGSPPQYDPKTEVTLQVTVTQIVQMEGRSQQRGTHLMVKSSDGVLEVDLGPQWFLADRKYAFAVGDALTVTGARLKRGERDAILAREIGKGGETMTFRDAKGFPLWAGRGRAGAGAAAS
jgi:hypothetical protein